MYDHQFCKTERGDKTFGMSNIAFSFALFLSYLGNFEYYWFLLSLNVKILHALRQLEGFISYAKLVVSKSVSTEFISLKDLPQNAAIMFAAACSF